MGGVVVVQRLMVEAAMVVITAEVGWTEVNPELVLVGGGAVTLGRMEVMGVDVEQDLQHMRW